jgi:hypothetical protein
MAVENTLIQIHKVCEPIIGFLNGGSGAAILAGFLTFVASRWSAEADRKEKIKDCRESFQKILPNYIERIKEMIETLNSERIRLSGENAEGPNTGSLASGKLLEGVGVQLKLITNLPFTGFFSYPEVVEAYTDKSHKSKLKHVRKVELIHKIFGSFENVYSTQLDFINLHNDSQREWAERRASLNLSWQEVSDTLISLKKSPSLREHIEILCSKLDSEFSNTTCDGGEVNKILQNFCREELSQNTPYPYGKGEWINEPLKKVNVGELVEYYRIQAIKLKLFEEAHSLNKAVTSYGRVLHSVMAIEKQILANFENTHNSLKQHLKHLERNFKELSGELNGNN